MRNYGLRQRSLEPSTHWLVDILIVLALWLAIAAFATAMFLLAISAAGAQHSHAQHHAHYQNWVNKADKGCCNDKDCGELRDSQQRSRNGQVEILVYGVGPAAGRVAWCPVERRHYLKTGNAPNADASHACITDHYGGRTPCEQFVCFQPRPGS